MEPITPRILGPPASLAAWFGVARSCRAG